MIKYTFIVPHKNIPTLLRRCLDSIPHRPDVQIIVVDDNSDPTTVDFAQFPGVGEPCTEVLFAKKDRGAGYARNVALERVRGEWVLFADADDYWITPHLEKLLDNIDVYAYNADVIYWTVKQIELTGEVKFLNIGHIDETLPTHGFKETDPVVLFWITFHAPWTKMVRMDLIRRNKLRFEETPVANDVIFTSRVVCAAKSVMHYTAPVYYREKREGSLFHQNSIAALRIRVNVLIRSYHIRKMRHIKPYFLRSLFMEQLYAQSKMWTFYYMLKTAVYVNWAAAISYYWGLRSYNQGERLTALGRALSRLRIKLALGQRLKHLFKHRG